MIHSFNGTDGAYPFSSLIIDDGALYGMTSGGGLDCSNDLCGCGTVYKLAPPATAGDAWSEEVLYRFGQFGLHPDDGTNPEGGLIFDPLGNLYGTTNGGGGNQCVLTYAQCGTVFQLSAPISGLGPWTETTLWKFAGGSDGAFPQAALVMDGQGALYGTTPYGGSVGRGIVFKLVPPAIPGVSWSEQVLHVFGVHRGDGEAPLTALLPVDGKFYGTTEQGGGISPTCYGTYGTVFTIAP